MAAALRGQLHSADSYHAGREDRERKQIQASFLANRLRIVVATVAFGMGLVCPSLIFCVHLCSFIFTFTLFIFVWQTFR